MNVKLWRAHLEFRKMLYCYTILNSHKNKNNPLVFQPHLNFMFQEKKCAYQSTKCLWGNGVKKWGSYGVVTVLTWISVYRPVRISLPRLHQHQEDPQYHLPWAWWTERVQAPKEVISIHRRVLHLMLLTFLRITVWLTIRVLGVKMTEPGLTGNQHSLSGTKVWNMNGNSNCRRYPHGASA